MRRDAHQAAIHRASRNTLHPWIPSWYWPVAILASVFLITLDMIT